MTQLRPVIAWLRGNISCFTTPPMNGRDLHRLPGAVPVFPSRPQRGGNCINHTRNTANAKPHDRD